jgi:hypothetical protein
MSDTSSNEPTTNVEHADTVEVTNTESEGGKPIKDPKQDNPGQAKGHDKQATSKPAT